MMTAFASKETVMQALNLGASAYITKPFDMQEVILKIKEILEKQRLEIEKLFLYNQLQLELEERKVAEKRIEHLNTVLKAVRDVNRLIIQEKDRGKLINGACKSLVGTKGFQRAWIVLTDGERNILDFSESGIGDDFIHLSEHLENNRLPNCCSIPLNSQKIGLITDCQSNCSNCPLRSDKMNLIGTRLEYDQKVFGVLCAHFPLEFLDEEEEQLIFQEVADDIAFALHDITIVDDRKRMLEELRIKDTAIESSITGFAISDLEGKLSYVNNSFLRIWGFQDKKEVFQHYFIDFWKDKENTSTIVQIIRDRGSYEGELTGIKKDGSYIEIHLAATIVRNEKGYPIWMIVTFNDITKRKSIEIALAKSRDSLARKVEEATRDLIEEKQLVETVIETIPDGIAVINENSDIVLANRVFKEYYQKVYNSNLPTSLKDLSLLENIFGDTLSRVYYSKSEDPITIKPIPGLYLQLVSSKLIISPNNYLGMIVAIRDVTPFVELDNLRKRFVSVVSHELRTPITAMNLSLRNLQKYRHKMQEEQQNAIIDMTADSALILTQMIEDLLITSNVEAGKVKISWEAYQPAIILKNVLKTLNPKQESKSITIEVDISSQISLYGDEKRISQIFRILLDNAMKYSEPNSKIIVKAINPYSGKFNPDKVEGTLIQIIDYGLGIPKNDLPHIFDSFFRARNVGNKRGTGLGLNIAQEIVYLHFGKIFVESEEEVGSTFSVFLPRLETPLDELESHENDQIPSNRIKTIQNSPLLPNRAGE